MPENTTAGAEIICRTLKVALKYGQNAVTYDDCYQQYPRAKQEYEEAILYMDVVLQNESGVLTGAQVKKLMEKREKYQARAQQLGHMIYRDNASRREHNNMVSEAAILLREAIPSINETNYVQPPVDPLLKPLWLSKILWTTMETGGYLTSHLYVPAYVWKQEGAKLAGVSVKIQYFQQFLTVLKDLKDIPSPSNEHEVIVFERTLEDAAASVERYEQTLLRSFPSLNVRDNEAERPPSPPAMEARDNSRFGKFSSLAAGFGKMVKQQAITAVERVAAAATHRVMDEELNLYVETLREVFALCQMLCYWIRPQRQPAWLSEPEAFVEHHKAIGDKISSQARYREKVEKIRRFLESFVCELALQDLKLLVELRLETTARRFAEPQAQSTQVP